MSTAMHSHRQSVTRRGSAMVASAMLIIVLASAGVAMVTAAVGHGEEQRYRKDEVVLLAAAESAFNAAYDYCQRHAVICSLTDTDPASVPLNHTTHNTVMRNGNCANAYAPVQLSEADLLEGGLTASVFNGASVSATITLLSDVDPTKWGDESYRIKAEATVGDFAKDPQRYHRRFVEAIIKPPPPAITNIFKNALYALDGYRFFGSGTTDSYNSHAGAYNPAVHGADGDISSKSWLTVDKESALNGADHTEYVDMALPEVDYNAPAGATQIFSNGAGTYAGGIAKDYTFPGPGTYQCAALSLAKATITIPIGGTVTLYVDGAIDLNDGSIVFKGDNSSGQACQLWIYQKDNLGGTTKINGNTNIGQLSDGSASRPEQLLWFSDFSGDISLNGNATVSMVLYAPRATLSHMNGTFDFLGSLLAKSFDGSVNGNFNFVYDTSLGSLSASPKQLMPFLRIVGWRTSTGPTATNDPTLE